MERHQSRLNQLLPARKQNLPPKKTVPKTKNLHPKLLLLSQFKRKLKVLKILMTAPKMKILRSKLL